MASFSTAKAKKINPLDKVIKKNPKYDHVQKTIDTGSSMTKYLKKIEEIKTNYRYQQDEIFKRMKITTFVQLLLQVADVDTVENDCRMDDLNSVASGFTDRSYMSKNAEVLATMTDRNNLSSASFSMPDSQREDKCNNRNSSLQGVIRGVGELDNSTEKYGNGREKNSLQNFALAERNLNKLQTDLGMPYLLLDIRDKDEYDACHIISALNYPTAMLSRSVNNETKEMLSYKNQPGKIIVLYDDDERICPKAATTLVERGYDNLFLLSGGMKLASKKFPEGLITGNLPLYFNTKDQKSTRRMDSAASTFSSNSMRLTSDLKNSFDREDVERLNFYLDEILMPTASRLATSRNSTRNSNATTGSMASVRTMNSIHEKPFR